MKKTAILIDGAWFSNALKASVRLPEAGVTADIIHKNAFAMLGKDEELFRIFYYDSLPFQGRATNPISNRETDYAKTVQYEARLRLFRELGEKPLVALRRGVLKARGWVLTDGYMRRMMQGGPHQPITENDVKMDFEQKGVDMRIGIDVATLSIKGIVERILLVSGDMDMIPAMKLARREGVQVAVVQVGSRRLAPELIEDSDLIREFAILV